MLKCEYLGKINVNENYTGYDGSKHWKILHNEVKKIKCDFCKQKGIKLMHGLHDSVNIHIGKKVKYPNDLKFTHDYIMKALQNEQNK
jgi:hypothetical protein